MWTMPPAIFSRTVSTPAQWFLDNFTGPAGASPGELVISLDFEDGAGNTSAVNTGSLGPAGDFTISGSGTPASIVASGGPDGSGYLSAATVFDGGFICFKAYPLASQTTKVNIATADFEISMYARFRSVTNRWGYVFWGWQNGSPTPLLYVETGTGKLRVGVNGGDIDTGYVQAVDNTWRKYCLRRASGTSYVLVDDVVVYSVADASNYNVGMGTTTTFEVGSAGNGAGGFSDADIDAFRFYNANAGGTFGGTLATHAPDIGGAYSDDSGGSLSVYALDGSGHVSLTGSGGELAFSTASPPGSAYYLSMRAKVYSLPTDGTEAVFGLALVDAATDNYFVDARLYRNNTLSKWLLNFQVLDAAGDEVFTSNDVDVDSRIALGAWFVLRVDVNDSYTWSSIDGVAVATASVVPYMAPTAVVWSGFAGGDGAGAIDYVNGDDDAGAGGGSPAPSAVSIFLDNFNGAAPTLLDTLTDTFTGSGSILSHTSDSGDTWSHVSGDTTDNLSLVGGQLVGADGASGTARNSFVHGDYVDLVVNFTTLANGATSHLTATLFDDDAGNYVYFDFQLFDGTSIGGAPKAVNYGLGTNSLPARISGGTTFDDGPHTLRLLVRDKMAFVTFDLVTAFVSLDLSSYSGRGMSLSLVTSGSSVNQFKIDGLTLNSYDANGTLIDHAPDIGGLYVSDAPTVDARVGAMLDGSGFLVSTLGQYVYSPVTVESSAYSMKIGFNVVGGDPYAFFDVAVRMGDSWIVDPYLYYDGTSWNFYAYDLDGNSGGVVSLTDGAHEVRVDVTASDTKWYVDDALQQTRSAPSDTRYSAVEIGFGSGVFSQALKLDYVKLESSDFVVFDAYTLDHTEGRDRSSTSNENHRMAMSSDGAFAAVADREVNAGIDPSSAGSVLMYRNNGGWDFWIGLNLPSGGPFDSQNGPNSVAIADDLTVVACGYPAIDGVGFYEWTSDGSFGWNAPAYYPVTIVPTSGVKSMTKIWINRDATVIVGMCETNNVSVFTGGPGAWTQVQCINYPTASCQGVAMTQDGLTLFVNVWDTSGDTRVDVYKAPSLAAANWSLSATVGPITGSGGGGVTETGVAVTPDGSVLAVGCNQESSHDGAVHVFKLVSGAYVEQCRVRPESDGYTGGLGISVAVSDDGSVVAAGGPLYTPGSEFNVGSVVVAQGLGSASGDVRGFNLVNPRPHEKNSMFGQTVVMSADASSIGSCGDSEDTDGEYHVDLFVRQP